MMPRMVKHVRALAMIGAFLEGTPIPPAGARFPIAALVILNYPWSRRRA